MELPHWKAINKIVLESDESGFIIEDVIFMAMTGDPSTDCNSGNLSFNSIVNHFSERLAISKETLSNLGVREYSIEVRESLHSKY